MTNETKKLIVVWLVEGKSYECERVPGLCPKCGALDAITALPPPLLAKQPDETTHVCLQPLGGCNHGFAFDAEPTETKTAAQQVADYKAEVYKQKRDARAAKARHRFDIENERRTTDAEGRMSRDTLGGQVE